MLLFLGAGASRAFGIPTMPEFIDIIDVEFTGSDLYQTVRTGLNSNLDLEALMTVLDDLSKSKEEILETITPHTFQVLRSMSRDDSDRHIKDSGVKEEAERLLDETKRIIRRECLTAVSQEKPAILDAYDKLFTKLSQRFGHRRSGDGAIDYPTEDIRVFTTNYDTCLEAWSAERQIEFSQGIRLEYGREVFNASYYDGSQPRLYKLHGSIDLFIKDGVIRRLPAFADTDGVATFSGEEYGQEYLFYPIEASGYGHVQTGPFLAMMYDFRNFLERDGKWIIIGSSLRDRTITSTLDDVLRSKPRGSLPRIALLDKNADHLVARLNAQGFVTLAEVVTPVTEEFPTQAAIDGIDDVWL